MTGFSGVKSFLLEKFWLPVIGKGADYNIFNTSTYAVLFGLGAAYIGYPTLKWLDIDLNREFFLAVTPYVFLGGAARVLEDTGTVDSFLLVTPFIYLIMFAVTAAALLVSRQLESYTDIGYHKIFGWFGVLLLLPIMALYTTLLSSLAPFIDVLVIYSIILGSGYLILKEAIPERAKYSFAIPIAAHYWDSTTSFVAINMGATEKHIVANLFIDTFGPAGLFLMKTLIVVPVVYYIDGNVEGDEKRYYLFLIALLGLGLGTRNLLSIATV